MKINKISLKWSTQLIGVGWRLARTNYALAMILVLVMWPIIIILNKFTLNILGSVVQMPLLVGLLYISRDWVEGKKSELSRLFTVFRDRALLTKLLPLFALHGVFSVIGAFLAPDAKQDLSTLPTLFPVMLLALVVSTFIYFGYPLMIFGGLEFKKAIEQSVKGAWQNLGFLILTAIVAGLAVAMGTILLILPAIFYVIPSLFAYNYVIYAAVYEDLDLDRLKETLEKRESDGK